jgi:YD repeat-containing protein
MMRRFVAYPILLCSLLAGMVLSYGQQPVTGFPPLGTFAGGPFDAVDLANLNVHFQIPIFGRAGRGIPLSYALGYDSLVWSPVSSSGASAWTPLNSTWGWRAITEAATGYVTYGSATSIQQCPYQVDGNTFYYVTVWTYSNFQYHDPGGATHPIPGQVVHFISTNNACGESYTTPITNALTSDGSGYFVTTSYIGAATVYAPGGLTIIAPQINTSIGPGSITDANGNTIQIGYNSTSQTTTITDTLGTTALTITGLPPTNAPTCTNASGTSNVTYQYTAPNGNAATVTISYTNNQVETWFEAGVTEFGTTNPNGPIDECLVNKISLPDGTYYQFGYESTNFGSGSSPETTARLASVTLPTGGAVEYLYHGSSCYNSDNCIMKDGSPTAMSREYTDGTSIIDQSGTWIYNRAVQSGQQLPQTTTTVIDPSGNETDWKFSSIYETQSSVYSGNGSSKVLLRDMFS